LIMTGDTRQPTQLQYLPIDADLHATKMSVFATLEWQTGRTVELPDQVGASDSSGSLPISIASISQTIQMPYEYAGQMERKAWKVVLKIPGDSPSSKLLLQVEPLNSHSQTIQWVNDEGRPTQDAPTRAGPGAGMSNTDRANWFRHNHFIYPAPPSSFVPSLGGRVWTFPVDPKYVSTLRMTFKTPQTVEFKDVPLEPASR